MAWTPIVRLKDVPEGVPLRTKIHDRNGSRNEGILIRQGRLWFTPDMAMYVYYSPTHWARP